jgi:hypothetical protein
VPVAKSERTDQFERTSSALSSCSNLQIQEMKGESTAAFTAGCPSDPAQAIELPNLDAEVEQFLVIQGQERENTKALDQLKKDSMNRMKALEELQVPNFDVLSKEQSKARESITRIRIVLSQDWARLKGIQDVVPNESLIGKEESASSTTVRQRRQSSSKKIEVQRTWVALVEEREIAQSLQQLGQENLARRKTIFRTTVIS